MTYRDATKFRSTECIYMAAKNPEHLIDGTPLYQTLQTATPTQAKKLAGSRSGLPLRENWDLMEVSSMVFAVAQKFDQRRPEYTWLM